MEEVNNASVSVSYKSLRKQDSLGSLTYANEHKQTCLAEEELYGMSSKHCCHHCLQKRSCHNCLYDDAVNLLKTKTSKTETVRNVILLLLYSYIKRTNTALDKKMFFSPLIRKCKAVKPCELWTLISQPV